MSNNNTTSIPLPNNSSSQGSVTNTNVNIPVIESYQPTVRVMRLYKPGFHLIQNLPNLPTIYNNDESNLLNLMDNEIDYDNSMGTDITLSSYLLLPDSFGDIYCGEKFSAYVAIVNGFPQIPFYNVSLSIRLQTTTAVIDLSDIRQLTNNNHINTTSTRNLSFNDNFDMIVEQKLTELGIHTLRVSVSYYLTANSNEAKTLRKFYRFNVLQPLILQSNYIEINNKPMIQCEVTNATKSTIFIDEVSFISTYQDIVFEPIVSLYKNKLNNHSKENKNTLLLSNLNNELILLQTGETYSFAFKYIGKSDDIMMPDTSKRDSIGYPLVKWCACMGEFSNFAGDYTILKQQKTNLVTTTTTNNTTNSTTSNEFNLNLNTNKPLVTMNQNIKFECISKPNHPIYVGNEFVITIRLYNYSDKPISMQLDTKSINRNINSIDYIHGICFIGLTNCSIGIIDVTDYLDIDIILYAISPGLYDIPNICFINKLSKKYEKYYMKTYCSIRIYDSIESDESNSM